MSGHGFHSSQQTEILRALEANGFMELIALFVIEATHVTDDLFRSFDNPAEAAISAYASAHAALSPHHIRLTSDPRTPVACQRGCWFCCTIPVQCSIPEVFLIAFSVQSWDDDKRAALIARLVRYRNEVHGKPVKSIDGKRLPCPLLIDNACSVYGVRPMICAGWTSVDVEVCKRAYRTRWSDTVPSPAGILEIRALYETAGAAVAEAIAKHDLIVGPVNLALALLIALTVEAADERWTRGEPIFASAMWTKSE